MLQWFTIFSEFTEFNESSASSRKNSVDVTISFIDWSKRLTKRTCQFPTWLCFKLISCIENPTTKILFKNKLYFIRVLLDDSSEEAKRCVDNLFRNSDWQETETNMDMLQILMLQIELNLFLQNHMTMAVDTKHRGDPGFMILNNHY